MRGGFNRHNMSKKLSKRRNLVIHMLLALKNLFNHPFCHSNTQYHQILHFSLLHVRLYLYEDTDFYIDSISVTLQAG